MSEMGWYSVFVLCPKCKGSGEAKECSASFSADGEFRFTRFCKTCNETVHWHVFASQLAHMALASDMEKAEEKYTPCNLQVVQRIDRKGRKNK